CYLVDSPQEFDDEGKELGPDAQVWKTYVKEADRVDEELVDGWNSFVIESYKNLKPGPADVSSQSLLVISQTLWLFTNGSQHTGPPPVPGPESPPFKASPVAICVNILWFLSLSLSIAVSLISMLAKEWCLDFMSGRTGPFGAQAQRRQQRWDGIVEWRMKEVIVMLPSLMHLSLLLFAIGLCVFLWDVHYGVAVPVVLVTVLSAGAYSACTILPFRYDFCPYGTVLSRLYKQFSSCHLQVKRDEEAQDEVSGKALHWMIVNCETPRSVDVALQSLAGGDKTLSPAMLERCNAWTLIRKRLKSVDTNGGQSNVLTSLYKRALDSHLKMRIGADGLSYDYLNKTSQLGKLVLGVQSCINSVIHQLLEQLGPFDGNKTTIEQCTLIGPRILEFECGINRIKDSDKNTGQARTRWGARYLEYNETTHPERSQALAENITQVLEQGIRGIIDLEPDLECILSASLVVLLCRKMVIWPYDTAGYFRRLIQAYQSQITRNIRHTRTQIRNQGARYQSQITPLAFLLGALSVANSGCSLEESPCYSESPSGDDMHLNRRSEKVLEIVWAHLMDFFYPETYRPHKHQYLIHGGLHLLAKASDYHLSSEDCMFISNLMDSTRYYSSTIDGNCLVHHIRELTSALLLSPNLDSLPPYLLACLRRLPEISNGNDYHLFTPEFYVFTVNHICRAGWYYNGLAEFFIRFPFPMASPRLIALSSSGDIISRLTSLIDRRDVEEKAFGIAQLWLLFNMSVQASNRISPSLSTLENMLLGYPGLKNNLENQGGVAEELEFRLTLLLYQNSWISRLSSGTYLYRVLECMLQQRCTPLPEKVSDALEDVPKHLRGIASFVDLEAQTSNQPILQHLGQESSPPGSLLGI
ncbi:hypothetical protein FRC11_005562, partial [Ceratobasidium sp. 423]